MRQPAEGNSLVHQRIRIHRLLTAYHATHSTESWSAKLIFINAWKNCWLFCAFFPIGLSFPLFTMVSMNRFPRLIVSQFAYFVLDRCYPQQCGSLDQQGFNDTSIAPTIPTLASIKAQQNGVVSPDEPVNGSNNNSAKGTFNVSALLRVSLIQILRDWRTHSM